MRPRETGYHRDVSSMLQRHLDYADLARFFSAAGNYAAALDMCASGLRLRGADAMLLVRRAQAHDALGNYTQAISDCQNALQLDPPAKVAILAATTLALQVGPRANDADGGPITLERHERAIASFADTAAIIMQLDLVITVDTAVAHLAGALGVPVWLLLRKRPAWRWPRTGHTTPWYPSMLLVRAQEPSWSGVIESVASRLRERTLRAEQ